MMDPCEASGNVPPPIVPPRGLAGLFDDYDPSSILDTSKFDAGQVFLNVYDLGDSETLRKINAVSTANNNLLIGGLFHAGVEVYGAEWCYGYTEEERSGVSCIQPRTHPQHTYRTTVPLGRTSLTKQEVAALTLRLAREWLGNHYHLIHNNCQNFCNAMCKELGVGRIPGWVDRAARTASIIDNTSRKAVEGARETAQLVRSMSLGVEETLRNTIQADPDEVQRVATDAVETVRRSSIHALETAQLKALELAEAAKVQASVVQAQAEQLTGVAQVHVQVIGEVVQARALDLRQKTQELLGGDIEQKAAEVGEKAQEHVRAIGSTLWSWGQELLGELPATAPAVLAPPSVPAAAPARSRPAGAAAGRAAETRPQQQPPPPPVAVPAPAAAPAPRAEPLDLLGDNLVESPPRQQAARQQPMDLLGDDLGQACQQAAPPIAGSALLAQAAESVADEQE